jgi:hypothetical protein
MRIMYALWLIAKRSIKCTTLNEALQNVDVCNRALRDAWDGSPTVKFYRFIIRNGISSVGISLGLKV